MHRKNCSLQKSRAEKAPEIFRRFCWVHSRISLIKTAVAIASCIFFALASFQAAVHAQGTVNFSNFAHPRVDAPFFGPDTTRLGPDWNAILYAGPRADSLAPVGPPVSFLSGAGAGYFFGGTRVIDSVPPGEIAFITVGFWFSGSGSSWESALCRGQASIFSVVTGGAGEPPSLPANLEGLLSVQLLGGGPDCIPEPKSHFLALLALFPFLLRQTLAAKKI